MTMEHMRYIEDVAAEDVRVLEHKEATYKGSWKRRGGVGAAMMLLRKSDRLEEILKAANWDVFGVIQSQPDSGDDGTALAEIRDLRRYLLLIEAEMLVRMPELRPSNVLPCPPMPPYAEKMAEESEKTQSPGTPEDGGHHARQQWELDDGIEESTISQKTKEIYYFRPTGGSGLLVNRREITPSLWEHLPRLRLELNNHEFGLLQHVYHVLYRWIESESKWRMKPEFVEHWGTTTG
jgi:hypothetical protein